MENTSKTSNESYHLLKGYFVDSESKEPIQLEYRFLNSKSCEIYSLIKDQIFHAKGENFFGVTSDLLDNLPPTSSMVFNHTIPVKKKGKTREFALLEEWLYPYQIKNSGTIVYKLKLNVDNISYETKPSTDFGGAQGIHGGALEQLRNLTKDQLDIHVCYFCNFFIEYNEYGGTDYRHDQLYCFREKPHLLLKINEVYPNLQGQEDVLEQTIHNMSALHSCDAFELNPKPRL